MGGSPDWMYDDERAHYVRTSKERWADGIWSDVFDDIKKVPWVGHKVDNIHPKIEDGIIEALCFDEDAIAADGVTIYICIYQNSKWRDGIAFAGKDIPFVYKV